jgi:hypothetical protein
LSAVEKRLILRTVTDRSGNMTLISTSIETESRWKINDRIENFNQQNFILHKHQQKEILGQDHNLQQHEPNRLKI